MSNKTLYLFTAQYPYGKTSEAFLETEILFLSKKFETIIIIPSHLGEEKREVPENVKVNTEFISKPITKTQKLSGLLSSVFLVSSIVRSEVKDKGFKVFWKGRKVLMDYLSKYILLSRQLVSLVEQSDLKTTVYYNYWFCNVATMALSILKNKNHSVKVVARAHGYDVYDERWGKSGIPFRAWKIKNINYLYLISQHGLDYVKERTKNKEHTKLKLSRLGIFKVRETLPSSINGSKAFIFASIARIIPLKNVDKIPILLSKLGISAHWIHFGDGEDMGEIKNICKELPSSITYELKGNTPNTEVIKFLERNSVDFFISLSSSEGLPVSMMEAQSFGIPILSTPVGGVPEIVKDGLTGFLLEKDNLGKNKEIILKALDYPFERERIVGFFDENFNAEVNYQNFVLTLIEL